MNFYITATERENSVSAENFFQFFRGCSDFLAIIKTHDEKLTKRQFCKIKKELENDVKKQREAFRTNEDGYGGCSDFLAIIKTHDEKLTKRQFCKIKKELENDVKKQREAFRTNEDGYADRLNTLLGIKTKKEVKEYFYNMQEGHNDLLEELEITYEDVQEDMELFFEKGMIKKKTTCITPVTIGGPFDILYFPSTALKEEFGKLNSIFDTITVCGIDFDDYIFYKKDLSIGGPFDILYFPSTALKEEFGKLNSIFDTITVCGIDFDDYIFYKKDLSNENAVVGLCGHEKEGFLELTEQKFQELKALELPYYVSCTSEI